SWRRAGADGRRPLPGTWHLRGSHTRPRRYRTFGHRTLAMTTRLIALDIDGTIVHPHSPGALPSARVTRAIRALGDAGVAVVLASGRMLPGTTSIARHLGLETPLICQQGCSVHAAD